MKKLESIIKDMPDGCYICQKKMWCGDIGIDIEHMNNDIDQPLNYAKAIRDMVRAKQDDTDD
jgi:hypothetical protein